MAKKANRLLCGILLCVVPALGQVHRVAASSTNPSKTALEGLPTLDVVQLATLRSVAAQSTESERASRYNSDEPTFPPIYDPATRRTVLVERSVHHLDAKALPISEADVIVLGYIASEEPHVSLDGTMLYSTFAFQTKTRLKGQLPSGAELERIGGVALLPDGRKRFIGETGKGLPEAGYDYLLFLKKESSMSFRIVTGFLMNQGHPVALDVTGDQIESQRPASTVFLQQVASMVRTSRK